MKYYKTTDGRFPSSGTIPMPVKVVRPDIEESSAGPYEKRIDASRDHHWGQSSTNANPDRNLDYRVARTVDELSTGLHSTTADSAYFTYECMSVTKDVYDVAVNYVSITDPTTMIADLPIATTTDKGVFGISTSDSIFNVDSSDTLTMGVDVSTVFSTGRLPSGWTVSSLRGRMLFANVNSNMYVVTLKVNSSNKGLFYYTKMDWDGNFCVINMII